MRISKLAASLISSTFLYDSTTACGLRHDAEANLDFTAIAAANNHARSLRPRNSSTSKKIALDNVRTFDGYKIQPSSTVIIDGDLIGSDPTGAEHVDGNGAILLPGLIDAHCHPSNVTHLESLARWGVTTCFTMACYAPQMCQSLKGHPGLPDLLTSSAPASAPGSVHGNITAMIDPTILVPNASAIPSWIDRQISSDPDYIKLIAETPGFDTQTLTALVDEARKRDKVTVTHAAAYDAYEQAITARSLHIHHAPLDTPLTAPLLASMLANGQIATPTLTMMRAVAQNDPARNFTAALESVRLLHEARIPILAGTDANLQPGVPASVPFGTSMHDELANLVEAGMSNAEALRAGTEMPARWFGLGDRGVIEVGRRADLVLVEGDPVARLENTKNVKRVWIGGVEVEGI